jgi:hypothetical protein
MRDNDELKAIINKKDPFYIMISSKLRLIIVVVVVVVLVVVVDEFIYIS